MGNSATALAEKGVYDKAIPIVQGLRDVPYYEAYLGYLYGKAGRIEEAKRALDDF